MSVARLNGPRVRALREVLGIKQADLARAIGVSPGYLSEVETGIRQPPPGKARRIADQLLIWIDQGLISHSAIPAVPESDDEAVA